MSQDLVGNVYAVKLGKDLFGAVRLIAAKHGHTFLYFDGFWDKVPSFDEVVACNDLGITYKSFNAEDLEKGWFRESIPGHFSLLGRRPRSSDPRHCRPEGTSVYQNPAEFVVSFLNAWRRRYDRKALRAEVRREEAAAKKAAAEAERKRRASLTLPRMAREKPFGHWAQMWPRRVVNRVRKVFEEATRELIRFQRTRDRQAMTAVFKALVLDLNALEKTEGCIETTEREDVVRRIEELASLVGLSNKNEALTGNRDW